jgi:class 3 adenylate cyclase
MNCGQSLAPGSKRVQTTEMAASAQHSAARWQRVPRYLAERVLQSRRSVEGERKAVTVLFADIKGSTDLIEHRDPEEARLILEPALNLMIDAVHRFDGIVSKVMGDGLMALFGAPLALEDHAVRACHSALMMRETLKQHSTKVRAEYGVELEIRIGLHSGEVVVLAVGNDLRMEYDAVGATVHLASRMERMAPAGTIRVTADTHRLASRRMAFQDIGPIPVRGFSEPLVVYELVGIRDLREEPRSEAHTLPLIGRKSERQVTAELAKRTQDRREGAAILFVGEAGIGKSRLSHEIAGELEAAGWLVLTARTSPYETGEAWRTAGRLLQARFGDARDGKTAEHLSSFLSDSGLGSAAPGLLEVMGWQATDQTWCALKPEQRRRRTMDACRGWLQAEARERPILLVVDDPSG